MKLMNTDTQYGSVARFFHWTIVLLIVNQFVVGVLMMWMRRGASMPGISPLSLITWHKSMGLLVLMLVIGRFAWRHATKLPSWPEGMRKWEESAIRFIEGGLYAVLFIMPAAGMMLSTAGGHGVSFFGLFTIPGFTTPNISLSSIGWFLHVLTSYAIAG
ncbi:MAG TPA: cytochrome b/b6 domain-containing protein, partial [Armatimonadota bacterium]